MIRVGAGRHWPGALLLWVVPWATPAIAWAGSLSAEVEGVRVELASEPGRPLTREATAYVVRLAGPDGTPLTGAAVTLQGRMADGMTVLAPLRGSGPGIYRGRVLFTMEGVWELRLRVAGKGKPFELSLTEEVGR